MGLDSSEALAVLRRKVSFGSKRKSQPQFVMSALPPKAAATFADRRVRYGPKAALPFAVLLKIRVAAN
jgi:hypothetical protein